MPGVPVTPVHGGGQANIAATALRYKGVPYTWGAGGPPSRGWDCSGFVNWVLGHDLGMVLPGGVKNFSGNGHGPVVVQYATWKSASTISGAPEPGDLCVWAGIGASGHIGIAIGPTQMISALDTQSGTIVTPIHGYGPAGVPVMYRRVGGGGSGNILPPSGCGKQAATTAAVLGSLAWLAIRVAKK